MPSPDRHAPDNKTITLRPPQDIRDYISEQTERRGVGRSALIYEALREKRAREESASVRTASSA